MKNNMLTEQEYFLYFQDPGSPLDLTPNGNRIATVLIYVRRSGFVFLGDL